MKRIFEFLFIKEENFKDYWMAVSTSIMMPLHSQKILVNIFSESGDTELIISNNYWINTPNAQSCFD